jgi:hypothetical protein
MDGIFLGRRDRGGNGVDCGALAATTPWMEGFPGKVGALAIAGGGSAWRRRWFTGTRGERQNSAPSSCGRLH